MPDFFSGECPPSFVPAGKPEFGQGDRIGIRSAKLASIPNIEAFLGAKVQRWPWEKGRLAAMAAWGVQGASAWARERARRRRVPFIAVDDGLFRALDYRRPPRQPYSLVVDYSGIYYDATRPSDLESLLNCEGWETPELLAEARAAMEAITRLHLSKYNHAPDASPYLLTTPGQRTRILILDQPVDDRRVLLGMADSNAFARMVAKAREEHPGAALFLKTHPAVLSKLRKGYLAYTPAAKGVSLITQDVSPVSLLAQADEVYTVNSQMGFEALMLGKRVHCFGLPFYAGWGLTDDSLPSPRRVKERTVEELFAAACILYSRYANPVTGEACTIHDIIRLLAEQRRQNERNSRYTCCMGFSLREFEPVRTFLSSTRGEAVRVKGGDASEIAAEAEIRKGRLAAPASLVDGNLAKLCARHGIPLVRVQKGLLPDIGSSSGLPLFSRPVSMVLDEKGVYDEPARPSALESLLEHGNIAARDIERGRQLLRFLVDENILLNSEFAGMKDHVAAPVPADVLASLPEDRPLLLVPGQDGIAPGPEAGGAHSSAVHDMPSLVRAIRADRPEAFILFLNTPGWGNFDANRLPEADLILKGVSPLGLFSRVAEVHTLSSLCGLDALLRGIPVHTYGSPFYAGWGLTTDKHTFRRRSRLVSPETLITAALVLYPSYYDWHTGMFCGPEEICRLHQLPDRPGLPLRERFARFIRALEKLTPSKENPPHQ